MYIQYKIFGKSWSFICKASQSIQYVCKVVILFFANLNTKRAKCFVALDKIKFTNGNIVKVIKHSKLKILNCNSFLSGLTNTLRLFGSCNALTTARSNPLTTSTFSRGIVCLCSISFLPLLCFYQRFFARETIFCFPSSCKYIYHDLQSSREMN